VSLKKRYAAIPDMKSVWYMLGKNT